MQLKRKKTYAPLKVRERLKYLLQRVAVELSNSNANARPRPQEHYYILNIGYYYHANCAGPEIKLQLWSERQRGQWNYSIFRVPAGGTLRGQDALSAIRSSSNTAILIKVCVRAGVFVCESVCAMLMNIAHNDQSVQQLAPHLNAV